MNEIIIQDNKKQVAMDKAGATRESAYKAMVDGLSSTIMVVDKYGEEHNTPDTSNRLKSAEMIVRLHGDLKPDIAVDNRKVIINTTGVTSDVLEGLMGMVKDVREQLTRLKDSGSQTGEIIDVDAVTR